MHLDAMLGIIVKSAMGPALRNEISAQLRVQHSKHVAIELRGHSGAVIVRRFDRLGIFSKIGSEQQPVALLHVRAYTSEQADRSRVIEISDRAAEKCE